MLPAFVNCTFEVQNDAKCTLVVALECRFHTNLA